MRVHLDAALASQLKEYAEILGGKTPSEAARQALRGVFAELEIEPRPSWRAVDRRSGEVLNRFYSRNAAQLWVDGHSGGNLFGSGFDVKIELLDPTTPVSDDALDEGRGVTDSDTDNERD